MSSRRNSSANAKKIRVRQRERKEELKEQQNQQMRARVDHILVTTASTVYASLVAKEWDGDEPNIPRDVLLKLASLAKASANVLGESLGMIKPPVIEPPQDDDRVVEIPNPAPEDSLQDVDSVVASNSDVVSLSPPVESSRTVEPSIVSSGSDVITLTMSDGDTPPTA